MTPQDTLDLEEEGDSEAALETRLARKKEADAQLKKALAARDAELR